MTRLARPALLAVLFLALPLGLLFSGLGETARGLPVYRVLAIAGLPVVVGLATLACGAPMLVLPRGGRVDAGPLRLLPFCAAAFMVDQGVIAVGHRLGWLTFTFGEQALMERPLWSAAWGVPLSLALALFGYERGLHGTLLSSWAERASRPITALVVIAAGTALATPSILAGPSIPDGRYAAAALVTAAAREAALLLIVLSGGGLLLAGMLRGAYLFVEVVVVNDWLGVPFPMANYLSSEPRFYAARALAATAALAVVALGAARATSRATARAAARSRSDKSAPSTTGGAS